MPLQRDAAQQRRRIVRSALDVLAREGIDAFSMRTVARRAGCTIGLINHWFSSKEDLITAAWQEAAETVNRNARRAFKEGISLALLEGSLATSAAKRRDQAVWLAFNAMTIGNRKLAAAHARYYANARGELEAMLTQVGHSAGEAAEIAGIIIAAIDGILYNAGIEPKYWTAARQRRALAKLVGPFLSPTSK
jgi:TetR/AcrR family transcriptional regulator, transcriptional repressor of bet genes